MEDNNNIGLDQHQQEAHYRQQDNQQQQKDKVNSPLKYIHEIPPAPSNESINPITIEE